MWSIRGSGRIATDYGFWGAVVGFFGSVVVFAVLVGLSIRLDRGDGCMGCACLYRLVALLVLTLGVGAGYLFGRSMMGG